MIRHRENIQIKRKIKYKILIIVLLGSCLGIGKDNNSIIIITMIFFQILPIFFIYIFIYKKRQSITDIKRKLDKYILIKSVMVIMIGLFINHYLVNNLLGLLIIGMVTQSLIDIDNEQIDIYKIL